MPSRTYPLLSVEVIDGDSLRVAVDLGRTIRAYPREKKSPPVDLGFHVWEQIIGDWWHTVYRSDVRLNGIDAPEMETQQAAAGHVVRAAVQQWIDGHRGKLRLRSDALEQDKYNRALGDVLAGEDSLCQWLLAEGLVHKYDGGTKPPWFAEELARIEAWKMCTGFRIR